MAPSPIGCGVMLRWGEGGMFDSATNRVSHTSQTTLLLAVGLHWGENGVELCE